MLCAIALAQQPSAEQEQRLLEFQIRYIQSPMKPQEEYAREITKHSSFWNGQATWMSLGMIEGLGGLDELGLWGIRFAPVKNTLVL
jgi:hypothetical protein